MPADGPAPSGPRDRWRLLLFPAVCLGALALLVALRISGTSSGVLAEYVSGTSDDPRLLAGAPRAVRSDEWLVSTPMMIAQDRAGLPEVNPDLAGGLDVTLVYGVPYADWSALFRPETWGFFALPLEHAYAWRWWSVKALLALVAYAFVLLLLPSRRLFAAAVSVGLVAAPFLAWWAGPGADGLLAYALLALGCVVVLLRVEGPARLLAVAAVLAYALACFGLVLYPPYQVPVALVVLAFSLGWLSLHRRERPARELLLRVAVAAAAALAAAAVLVAFLVQRREVVDALAGTAYPGDRVVRSGGYSLVQLLFGFLTPFLQLPQRRLDGGALSLLGGNQSEASAFLLPGLFLLGVQVWLVARARRRRLPCNDVLVGLLAVQAVFLGHLFLVAFDRVAGLLLLHQVPHQRLQMGLGLLSTLQVVVVVWELGRQQVRAPAWLAVATGGAACLLMLEVGARLTPDGVPTPWRAVWIVPLAAVVAALPVLLVRGRPELAGVGLALFGVLASGAVNPLYRGLPVLPETAVGRAVQAAEERSSGGWVATGDLVLNAVLVESGVRTYSAAFGYPVFEAWTELDPDGRFRDVYNRYAHVVFVPGLAGAPLQNPQADVVLAALDGCGAFAQRRLAHVLSAAPVSDPCLRPAETVAVPGRTFYVYDVVAGAGA